jgi:uncharacterized membrane protein
LVLFEVSQQIWLHFNLPLRLVQPVLQCKIATKIFWLHLLRQVLILLGHVAQLVALRHLASDIIVDTKTWLQSKDIALIWLHLHGVVKLRVIVLLLLKLSWPSSWNASVVLLQTLIQHCSKIVHALASLLQVLL